MACQLRTGFKSMISNLRFDWSRTPSKKKHFETPFKFFEVIFGPSYGRLNNEGKFLKCTEYLNDNLRQVLTITDVACGKFGDHSRLLVTLSLRVFHKHLFSFQFLSKPFSSATNFTEEFFNEQSEFKDMTRRFNNPGYKIASGPIVVEFMLQER